ncbi:MAG: hypothetical protein II704_04480 [Erysipelotrichaceae bacterium]|nr:hypothetical protein [Erysipelotrichaceae bacterium]
MIRFFQKLTYFFLKFVGKLDADGKGGIDFFEELAKPGMPELAEKFGRFGWPAIVALIAAVILLGMLIDIKRHDVGIALAVLLAVGIGYYTGHGILSIAFIISTVLVFMDRRRQSRR